VFRNYWFYRVLFSIQRQLVQTKLEKAIILSRCGEVQIGLSHTRRGLSQDMKVDYGAVTRITILKK